VRKIQSQGVHHITLVGADRQTSIDFWEGVLGMPFVFEQPNLDNAVESHLYFDPGDGRLITVFTNEERAPDPSARRPTRASVPPHRVLALAGDLRADRRAPRRARDPRTAASRTAGFMDSIYFDDPLGQLIELASYRFEPPLRSQSRARCCSRRTGCRGANGGDHNIARCTWPTRSSGSS
jgi:catechol 2,3-dioxygenase-like lactoylglutathione lyase family enzyme